MSARPGSDDDDTTVPARPDVTVPPWLRGSAVTEGPGPGAAAPAGVGHGDLRPGGPGQEGETPGASRGGATSGEARSTRIRLGARGPGAADSASGGGPVEAPARERADDLSTLSLRPGPEPAATATGAPAPASATASAPDEQPDPPGPTGRRGVRLVLLAAGAVAVLGGSSVLGFVVARSALAPPEAEATACTELVEPGRVVGAGPGDLTTPAGTVLAFDHAYYVERSAAGAFEAVAPSSRMTEEQLRVDGVERLAEGTTHCVDIRELSPTLLEVELTEFPPDADPVFIRQRVRVAENPDGTWGIVSITPAG